MQRAASASDLGAIPQRRAGDRCRRTEGFSLIELVVVMSIVVLLVSMLMPGLRGVRESTRRLQCANHMRMIGMGIVSYGSDHLERLPYSRHAERKSFHDLMALNVTEPGQEFDGLGLLLPYQGRGYVDSPACFFCPSHCGDHEAERTMPLLRRPGGIRLFGNYHYRGHVDHLGRRLLLGAEGDRLIVLTDGLRTRSDFNHGDGTNLLRSDGSVQWWFDSGNTVSRSLPISPMAEGPDDDFEEIFVGFLTRLSRETR